MSTICDAKLNRVCPRNFDNYALPDRNFNRATRKDLLPYLIKQSTYYKEQMGTIYKPGLMKTLKHK